MNEKKYLSYLERYHQWLKAHQEKASEELAERDSHAKEMQKFDKTRLLKMTDDDVYNLLKKQDFPISVLQIYKDTSQFRLCSQSTNTVGIVKREVLVQAEGVATGIFG